MRAALGDFTDAAAPMKKIPTSNPIVKARDVFLFLSVLSSELFTVLFCVEEEGFII